MFRVVVAEFCQGKEVGPVGLLVVAIQSQVLLQHRVEPLRLAIRLRVERGRPIGPNATELQETMLEVGREDRYLRWGGRVLAWISEKMSR